jgi:Flp pilus assembly pilin Flp
MTERTDSATAAFGLAARFLADRRGSTAIEYAVLIGMIALFIVAIGSVGQSLGTNYFDTYAQHLKTAN